MDVEALKAQVEQHYWFHQIDLGHGVVTPGPDRSQDKLVGVGFPDDLTGKTVLDVGTFNGFFAFEAERRGASRVVAADDFIWRRDPRTRAAFDFAHQTLGSRVEPVTISIEDMTPEALGTFDVVLFLGIIYHAEDPMRYLRICHSLTEAGGTAIVESHVDGLDIDRPAMVFYPGDSLNHDPTNFWGPNPAAIDAVLREVGYSHVDALPSWLPGRHTVHARN